MARTVRDTALGTRAERMRLKARHEPYWRALDRGLHLGYRKGPRGGIWRARAFLEAEASGKRYYKAVLGVADDILDADGVATLSFSQAQSRARVWFVEQTRSAAGLEPLDRGPYTVSDAIRDYLTAYSRRGKGLSVTSAYTNAHILPTLGSLDLSRLTTKIIRGWHQNLAESPRRVRARRDAERPQHGEMAVDHESKRRRRASANRVLTILKAAFNHAWRDGKTLSDQEWRKVRPFQNVNLPVVRYLTESESARLANSCEQEFRPLINGALLTGCRYGELVSVRVMDFNEAAGLLTIRASKSGKPRHVVLSAEGRQFFYETTAGKPPTSLIFTRADGSQWGKSHQQRPLAKACKRARISPPIGFHVLRHTHGTTLAMRGVPLPVIAKQLGHADTRMTERHYAHLSPNYVADAIRAGFPTLGLLSETNLTPLRLPGKAHR